MTSLKLKRKKNLIFRLKQAKTNPKQELANKPETHKQIQSSQAEFAPKLRFFVAKTCQKTQNSLANQKLVKKPPVGSAKSGGGQNLERQNVERPIFRNFKIANIKITKDEIFDNFTFKFNFFFFRNHLNTQNI